MLCRGLLSRFYSTVFLLQEGDVIVLESYARIKHLQTKTWLHLEKGMQLSGYWKEKNLNCQGTLKRAINSAHNIESGILAIYYQYSSLPSQTFIRSGSCYM